MQLMHFIHFGAKLRSPHILWYSKIGRMENNISVQVLVGEKEELYTIIVSPEQHEQILNGSKFVITDSLNLI